MRPTPKRPSKPAGGTGGRDFDLADYFDSPVEPTSKPARPTARPFPRPGKPDNGFWDVVRTTTTKRPKTTQAPRKQNPGKNPLDLDLADALGDRDDARDGRQPAVRPEEGFSDSDLEGIVDDGYSPDKKKGSGGNTDSQDNRVETGTIAGIASALAMALVGAVSSYISYQQKKFCFSIQRKQPRVGVGGLRGGGLQSGTWCVGTPLQVKANRALSAKETEKNALAVLVVASHLAALDSSSY
ncbi:CD99 antigen-like protein 2 [Meleagris gallopavo]|uniref:CD99 antigen-like protein 2 n=1 Tax=Meleagris gallopavo TaxID=9103 RepID=G1N7Q0_MELGA|nr:CD99 antigen-like protein 2 [Meleagris gallopavo]